MPASHSYVFSEPARYINTLTHVCLTHSCCENVNALTRGVMHQQRKHTHLIHVLAVDFDIVDGVARW